MTSLSTTQVDRAELIVMCCETIARVNRIREQKRTEAIAVHRRPVRHRCWWAPWKTVERRYETDDEVLQRSYWELQLELLDAAVWGEDQLYSATRLLALARCALNSVTVTAEDLYNILSPAQLAKLADAESATSDL